MTCMRLSALIAGASLIGLSAGASASTKAKYHCNGGTTMTVVFKNNKARVTVPGAEPIMLTQALSGDGFLYTKKGYSLRGVGNRATWTPGKGKPLTCKAR